MNRHLRRADVRSCYPPNSENPRQAFPAGDSHGQLSEPVVHRQPQPAAADRRAKAFVVGVHHRPSPPFAVFFIFPKAGRKLHLKRLQNSYETETMAPSHPKCRPLSSAGSFRPIRQRGRGGARGAFRALCPCFRCKLSAKAKPPTGNCQGFVLALPIFPGRRQPSIVGRNELNYRVRNGNGWTLALISTNYLSSGIPGEHSVLYCLSRALSSTFYIQTPIFTGVFFVVTRTGFEPMLTA